MCGDQRSIGRDSSLGMRWVVLVLLAVALALPAAASAAEPTGQITGKVTSASTKAAIPGIEVCAAEDLFEAELFGHCSKTNASGEYSISGLPAGSYGVGFFAPEGSGLNYVRQYYNGKSFFDEAELMSVKAGQTVSGVNAVLATGGRITGKVISASSKAAIEGVHVCAYSEDDGYEQCAKTNAGGEYTVSGLSTGSYEIEFFAGEDLNYVPQYSGDLLVEAGQTTSSINATMQTGGQITGKVTSASSKAAIEGIEVCASDESDFNRECAKTNPSGEYKVSSLPTTNYTVEFYAPEGSGLTL